jgi:hypothetical protein
MLVIKTLSMHLLGCMLGDACEEYFMRFRSQYVKNEREFVSLLGKV